MSTISKLNVDAIIDKSITSDKLADDFMLLSDALENEEVTAAALTELNNTKADKTAIDEITQALASKADAEAVSALQQDLDSKVDPSELSNYLPLSGGILTGNFQINGKLTIPGLESNNDYIESVRYVNGLWGTESGKSPEITHDLASIKNAIKFNWYNDDWIIGNIRAGSASSDGFGIGMEKTKSDGTTIYQKNIFRLSPDGEIYLNGTPLANKYLSLSGGTLTGELKTKQITIGAESWLVSNGSGILLQRADGTSYIWNAASKSIAIGTNSVGQSSELNASLVIKGTNIYPGTSNKFSLGTDSYKFKDILADGRVVGGRFLTGYKAKTELESNTNTGLSIVSQLSLNGSTASDYGFPANNNANGVLAFRTFPSSGEHYMHYLGFSSDGEIYHRHYNSGNTTWRNITNPFGSIRMPRTIDNVHGQGVIPNMLNEGVVNIFNYPLKSELLIERSQDGITWIDVTEDEYENFRRGFTKGYNQGGGRYVAYDKTNGKVGDRLRITYNPSDRYCTMGYIDVYYATSGATTTFTLEHNTKADINTWTKIHDSKSCTGWPGHNYYGLLGYSFGQSNFTTGAYAYRMTFEITAVSSSSNNFNNLGAINYIYGFTAQTPYSTRSDSYFRYDVTLQAYRNTGHIIPSSTGYELGNQQFPFKTVITQNLAISVGSGHTPNYITSDTNRNMFIKIADVVPFVVDCADTNNPVVRSGSSMAGKVNLGASTNKWNNVYANKFYGDLEGNATNDGSGNKIVDTYALASTCYGGPEGKFAIGNSDNLIGKTLTGSWGIYNKYHDIVISEYDASTNTWVEKFNSTTLTPGSANYNAFVKGEKWNFYTSTRGSKVKLTVTSNAGSVYVQAIGLHLKTKDTTYNGNIDYSYWTNGGVVHYSDVNGTWGSWCNITMSGTYRKAFEIFFNEGGANAQIAINGFRIVTQTDGIVPVLIGKSHESYKADHATTATTATTASTASTATKVGDNTLQLYAQSGNEINFGGINTTNSSIIFGYKSADGNQIVPTQYKFGKDATASVYAAKFITTGGTASQVVLGDGTLKNVSELGSSSLTYATLANTNIINAGFNYNNTYSGLTIDTYTGFTMDTPDTVIVSTFPITFTGSCMKMEGIENLSGTYYIYCLSYMANGMIAINGAVYN